MNGTNRTLWILTLVLGAARVGEAQAASATAAEPTPAQVGPKIQFAELAHDFGKIDAGTVARHEFVFTNAGNAALEILDVRPGCGCTTAGAWDKRVEPGKTGRIPLAFNSTGFGGTVAKSATVTCNDATRSNVFLQIKATIWRPIDITPQSAFFNLSSDAPTNETRVVRIVSNLEAPLALADPVCTNHAFRAELKTVKPGKEFELAVTVHPPITGTFAHAPITLQTSATNTPVLTIPAYAYVRPAITVLPSQITLPAGPLAKAVRPSVTIQNTTTNALVVSNATINIEGVALDLKETQPGRMFMVTLDVPAGLQLEPAQRIEVSLQSNHPKFPVIKVPVVQQRAPVTPVSSRPSLHTAPLVVRPVTVPSPK